MVYIERERFRRDSLVGRQDQPKDRQAGRQTDRQTDRHTVSVPVFKSCATMALTCIATRHYT